MFCLGNHCRLTEAYVERSLRGSGVNATAPGLAGKQVLGKGFFGTRSVPLMGCGFLGESSEEQLQREVDIMRAVWAPSDILLAHCPPKGVLSGPPSEAWGNKPLALALARPVEEGGRGAPATVLCGHIHECYGRTHMGTSVVINSATSWSVVET